MCIVIDTNVLSDVFDKESKDHQEFKPIFEWIYNGKGKVVFGGNKYLDELRKYRGLFLEFRKVGKAILIPSEVIEKIQLEVTKTIKHKDFDDQHLVSLLIASGCKLICSKDARAFPFFRHSTFFTPASRKPKIYSQRRNAGLLKEHNIAEICKPCTVLNNELRQRMPAL